MNSESQTPTPTETEGKLTAGQASVKNIRPAGCALSPILAILVSAVCLPPGRDPGPRYEPALSC